MSTSLENMPVLLKVEETGDVIVLRIDTDGLCATIEHPNQVVLVNLKNCTNRENVLPHLDAAVGQVIEWNHFSEGAESVLQINVNYASDSVELKCEYIKEAQTDYTVEDLRLKATRLSALYQETSGDLEASHIQHSHLVERIRSEARKEIDRGLQKENFFLKMKSEKAKIVEGKRAAYQNILKIIQELESKAPKC
jgi:hypothetical protein